jgi:hypothetical protein
MPALMWTSLSPNLANPEEAFFELSLRRSNSSLALRKPEVPAFVPMFIWAFFVIGKNVVGEG